MAWKPREGGVGVCVNASFFTGKALQFCGAAVGA